MSQEVRNRIIKNALNYALHLFYFKQTSEVKEPPRKYTDNSVLSHFNQLQTVKVEVQSEPFTKQKAARGKCSRN
jgi:hypothetical protein